MEYGKVHGPYQGKHGKPFVIIVIHNEDRSIKSKKTMSYSQYIDEYATGKHQYISLFTRNSVIKKTFTAYYEEHVCEICRKTYSQKIRSLEILHYVCSKRCREKLRRKLAKKNKLVFQNQYIVLINKKEQERYYIVYEKDSSCRGTWFVPVNKTEIVISEDENKVVRYALTYDKKNAVKVKPVPGYKKYFWITETGVLISRRSKNIMSQTISEKGYYTHSSKIGGRKGKCINLRIHRCVADAFILNLENKPQVNHIDGIKTNNTVDNLEWCTGSENTQHAYNLGLAKLLCGEKGTSAKITNKQADEIRVLHKKEKYTHKKLGMIYGLSRKSVTDIVNYKTYKEKHH